MSHYQFKKRIQGELFDCTVQGYNDNGHGDNDNIGNGVGYGNDIGYGDNDNGYDDDGYNKWI